MSAASWVNALQELGIAINYKSNDKDTIDVVREELSKLSKLSDPKTISLLKAKLKSTIDYQLQYDDKGNVIRILPGKALLYSERVWNKYHYFKMTQMINNNASDDAIFDYITNSMLFGNYVDFTKSLSEHGYRLSEEYLNVNGFNGNSNSPYYTTDSSGTNINPLVFTFFMMDLLGRSWMDATYMGDAFSFESNETKVKRSKVTKTGYIAPGTSRGTNNDFEKGTIRGDINIMVVDDNKGEYVINGKKYNTKIGDGQGRIGLVFEKYMRATYGGQFSIHGDGAAKTIGMSNDLANGHVTQIKYSQDPTTKMLFEKFPAYRDMEEVLLTAWSDKVNKYFEEEGIDDRIDLWDVFVTNYNSTNDADLAAEAVRDYIIEHRYCNAIDANIFAGFFNQSTVKTASSGLMDLTIDDITNIEEYYGGFPHITIQSDDYGIITNLSQDTSNSLRGLAWSAQLASTMSQFENSGSKRTSYADRMKQVKTDLVNSGIKEMKLRYNDLKSKFPNLTKVQLIHRFMRDIANDVFEFLGDDSTLKQILANPTITLNTPAIESKIKSIFTSFINKHAVTPRTNGYRGTAVSGDMLTFYKLVKVHEKDANGKWIEKEKTDGAYYTIDKLEKKHSGYTYDREDDDSKKFLMIDNYVYEKVKLKAMHWDENGELVPGTVAMRNPVLEEYKMTLDEDVVDVYTMRYAT